MTLKNIILPLLLIAALCADTILVQAQTENDNLSKSLDIEKFMKSDSVPSFNELLAPDDSTSLQLLIDDFNQLFTEENLKEAKSILEQSVRELNETLEAVDKEAVMQFLKELGDLIEEESAPFIEDILELLRTLEQEFQ